MDFLERLGRDLSSKILMCLEDPSDLVRASTVSRSWRHFVIANGFCQQLCVSMIPQLSKVAGVREINKCAAIKPLELSCSDEWKDLEMDHRVYAYLARVCSSFRGRDCITRAICASSTDTYPGKIIDYTLTPCRAFYWSSKGQSNPEVPETLTYKLVSEFCVINEINICPFQAYFQSGLPVYSAKSVRFRVGYCRSCANVGRALVRCHYARSPDEKFIWTYTSQEFPMAQKSDLQKFKLPKPVICVGGILQIELLGRVQRHEVDGLYYICLSFVQVVGRSLSPAFGVEIRGPSGEFDLICNTLFNSDDPPDEPDEMAAYILHGSARDLRHIGHLLRGPVAGPIHGFD